MEKQIATLYTARGARVAAVEVPPFDTGYPPAILWGVRFFLRQGDSGRGDYYETFCYAATVEVIDRADARRDGPDGAA